MKFVFRITSPLVPVLGAGLFLAACSKTMAQNNTRAMNDTDTTTVIQNEGEGTTRITVSGNQAASVVVGCDAQGKPQSANINSVEVNGASLKGKTVILTGHNTPPVHVSSECKPGDTSGRSRVNVNSVLIR